MTKHQEHQYLDLIQDVFDNGIEENDRTGVGTLSVFGRMSRWSLHKNLEFPLLTTKRVFWRAVAAELLWFMRGETDNKLLQDQNVHIWDGNSSREFLDSRNLHNYEQGDIGPGYGFQWRHFGADYEGCNANYHGKGIDQLKNVIDALKAHVASGGQASSNRRMIMTAWNPVCLDQMALPPCHILAQFYIGQGNRLSCSLYQRSCDMGLGVPFNIASYALLTCMLAHHCGLERGEFIHFMGNVHVYKNHIDALKEQIKRDPRPWPRLEIRGEPKQNIEDYTLDDFILTNYNPHKSVAMQMAV